MQQERHGTCTRAPSPRPFTRKPQYDHAVWIESIGRAVDEVVGAFVVITDANGKINAADLRRLVAATRRLWTFSLAHYRERSR